MTISNFANDIDEKIFRDHIVEDTREIIEITPIVISNISVRLVKDPEIDRQCNDFNVKNHDQGTGNISEDVSIKTEPHDEDDPDR